MSTTIFMMQNKLLKTTFLLWQLDDHGTFTDAEYIYVVQQAASTL